MLPSMQVHLRVDTQGKQECLGILLFHQPSDFSSFCLSLGGKNESNFSRITLGFSPATIKKHGDGNKGKRWITNGSISYQIKDDKLPEGFYYGQTEEHRVKNSKALSGDKNPMFGKFGNQHPAFGNKHTDEMIAYLSETRIGINNPMYGKLPHNAKSVELNGVVYKSMTEARIKTGMSRRTLEKLVKGN